MATLRSRIRFIRALYNRPFTLLWIGQTISSLGDGAYNTALAWFILLLTGSATAMGIVVTASAIPRILFLLFGGVVADRLQRRLVMLWSDTGRALVVLLIAILAWLHLLQIWHLVILSLVFGFVDGFFIPAYQSIPPQLVPSEDLSSANALNELSQHGSQLLGPLLGATCVALVGPASAFGLDGLTFFASALCLLFMHLPAKAKTLIDTTQSRETKTEDKAVAAPVLTWNLGSILKDMHEGLRYVTGSTWIWVTIVISALGNIVFVAPLVVAMPKLIHDAYGAGVWLLGAIAAASAIGAILAVLIVGQLKQIRWRGIKAYLSLAGSALALLIMGIPLPHASEAVIAIIAGVVLGFGLGFFNVIWFIVLQQMIPADKLGRVSSIDMMGSLCLTPIGYVLGGILTDYIGPRLVFIACGIIALLLEFTALTVRGVRQLD
jgi:MFS family permease